jgi:hypothetical protein
MTNSSESPNLRPSLAQRYFLHRARPAFATHQQAILDHAWSPLRHFVVENGKNLTVTVEAGHALRAAAIQGHLDAMKRLFPLLEPGSREGREALVVAVMGDRPESVRLLRRWGVEADEATLRMANSRNNSAVTEALKARRRFF